MVTDSAALVMFAVRSLLKLGQQSRLVYVDATRRRDLALPLPNFFIATTAADAVKFFQSADFGKKYVDGYQRGGEKVPPDQRLATVLVAYKPLAPDPTVEKELIDFHTCYQNLFLAETQVVAWQSGEPADPQDISALFAIQQWRRGTDPTPSALQRMAGTLIEMGLDYAATQPDLFDKNARRGKAFAGFLTALDRIDFTEADLSEIPARLFVATMETLSENPVLLCADQKVQQFIQVTTGALGQNAAHRIQTINATPDNQLDAIAKRDARLGVQDWVELVFRSTLTAGGQLVLSNPGRFLGVQGTGHQALIASVGGSMLDVILDDPGDWADVLSRAGLETVFKAALKVVGEHPEILANTNDEGIKTLLSAVATSLSQVDSLKTLGILPEIARLILEKTAENVDLLWPDLKHHPEHNLLVVAARMTLQILCRQPVAGQPWTPRFSGSDLLNVTDAVLSEVVTHPGWLIDKTSQVRGTLEDVLSAALGVLRQRGDARLSSTVAAEVLCATLQAVALRQEFVRQLPHGQQVIIAALDAVMATIFKPDLPDSVTWQLVRAEVIAGLTRVVMERLAHSGLDQKAIHALQQALDTQINLLAQGTVFNVDAFAPILTEKLAA